MDEQTHCRFCLRRFARKERTVTIESWNGDFDICLECADAETAGELLALARDHGTGANNLKDALAAAEIHGDNVAAQLVENAGDAARRDDFGQAMHLLRLAAEPKYSSIEECRAAYDNAMAEKRGAVTV